MRKRQKRIPPSVKSIYPILMLITCLLMSVGYATMNGLTMKIEGLSQALEQKGIIITEANFKNLPLYAIHKMWYTTLWITTARDIGGPS